MHRSVCVVGDAHVTSRLSLIAPHSQVVVIIIILFIIIIITNIECH